MSKLIKQVIVFVDRLGGKRLPRLPFWNAADDDPRLDHANFEILIPTGRIIIEVYVQKQGVTGVDYLCSGDSYRNRFSARFIGEKPTPHQHSITNGFLSISEENLRLIVAFLESQNA